MRESYIMFKSISETEALILTDQETIIVAVDLTDECHRLVERAKQVAVSQSPRILLAHVCEPVALSYSADIPLDLANIEEDITDKSREALDKLAEQCAIAKDQCRLITGSAEQRLDSLAQTEAASLIVVGNHSKSGLLALFGGTATGLVTHAPCDILAVKLEDN